MSVPYDDPKYPLQYQGKVIQINVLSDLAEYRSCEPCNEIAHEYHDVTEQLVLNLVSQKLMHKKQGWRKAQKVLLSFHYAKKFNVLEIGHEVIENLDDHDCQNGFMDSFKLAYMKNLLEKLTRL